MRLQSGACPEPWEDGELDQSDARFRKIAAFVTGWPGEGMVEKKKIHLTDFSLPSI